MPMSTDDRWIDVSMPITEGMVHWPGDPPVAVVRETVEQARISRLALGSHSGTHIDAPAHYVPGGAGIETMPIDATVGPARVVAIESARITAADLEPLQPTAGERLLLKTPSSSRRADESFDEHYVGLTLDAARFLARRGIRCVGIDYLSIAAFHEDGPAVHRALLEHGIWIIEGLRLVDVAPGSYELICLPLRLTGDGAPARAVLRRG